MPVNDLVDCDPRSWEARAFLVRKIPDSCIEVWIGDTGAANDIVG